MELQKQVAVTWGSSHLSSQILWISEATGAEEN